jgi:hypothetical protein
MDEKPTMTLVAFLLAAIAMTAAIFALTCCKSQDVAEADVAQVMPIERASGCPLDAIEYDVPAFMEDNATPLNELCCYKVVDRLNGASWWLLRMRGEWIVLPIMNTEVTNAG